jgi:hypothetical protein
MEKCEEKVGTCEREKEFIELPPKTIYLEMPSISAPEETLLTCEAWTDEQIRANPVGYEEALHNDILALVDGELRMIDYIERLEAARKRLEEEAKEPE